MAVPRLKIAVIAPPWFPVPPTGYGGIESVCAGLVDGLVELGHDVTLIGAGQDGTDATRFFAATKEPQSDSVGARPHLGAGTRRRRCRFSEISTSTFIHDHTAAPVRWSLLVWRHPPWSTRWRPRTAASSSTTSLAGTDPAKPPHFRLAENRLRSGTIPAFTTWWRSPPEDWHLLPEVPPGMDSVNLDSEAEERLEGPGTSSAGHNG